MREPLDPGMFDGCGTAKPPIRVGEKWTAKILVCLQGGPRRFTELRVPLHQVSAKVLTESLRAMERDGMVTRTAFDEVPPRVEYALTPLGHSLFGPLEAACAWTRAHAAAVEQARAESGHASFQ